SSAASRNGGKASALSWPAGDDGPQPHNARQTKKQAARTSTAGNVGDDLGGSKIGVMSKAFQRSIPRRHDVANAGPRRPRPGRNRTGGPGTPQPASPSERGCAKLLQKHRAGPPHGPVA